MEARPLTPAPTMATRFAMFLGGGKNEGEQFYSQKPHPKPWLLNKPGKEFGRLRDFLSLSPL